jgi:hydroxymethylbilane synthase
MSVSSRRIVLGTRGSDLARTQTAMVEEGLRTRFPGLEIAIEIITTRGDENSRHADEPVDRNAGRKGAFTREIERALLERRIDVAVHSAKDLPSDSTAALHVCAALPRAAADDVLITKTAATLDDVPIGGTIATGSVRRQYQLRSVRPDLQVIELHGNVPTRLRKLTEKPWEGIILARAGLERLGFNASGEQFEFDGNALRTSLLPRDTFVPAGGQGIIALQVRRDDEETGTLVEQLNHPATFACLRAEREFLRILQGDCGTPVGVFASIADGVMTMRAQLFSDNETAPRVAELRETIQGHTPEAIGARLLEMINGR